MARKEKKRSFFERLTYKYQLIIRNEEDFAEKTTFTITYGKVAMWIFVMFSFSFVLSFFAGKYLLNMSTTWKKKNAERMIMTIDLLTLLMLSVKSMFRFT